MLERSEERREERREEELFSSSDAGRLTIDYPTTVNNYLPLLGRCLAAGRARSPPQFVVIHDQLCIIQVQGRRTTTQRKKRKGKGKGKGNDPALRPSLGFRPHNGRCADGKRRMRLGHETGKERRLAGSKAGRRTIKQRLDDPVPIAGRQKEQTITTVFWPVLHHQWSWHGWRG